jgi:hypothetical protein
VQTLSILRHAVLQITRQPVEVLRIFVVPMATTFLLIKLTGLSFILSPVHLQIAINRGVMPWGKATLVMLVSVLLFAWAAAAWHRFILLEERPTKPWPSLPLRTLGHFILETLWVAVLIFAVIMLASFISGVILGFAATITKQPPGWIALGLSLAVALPILTVTLRLAVNLPKAAVEGPKDISVWDATADELPMFIALLVVLTALRLGSSTVLGSLGLTPMSAEGFVAVALVESLLAILSLSIITTLYGHYVEDRPLV